MLFLKILKIVLVYPNLGKITEYEINASQTTCIEGSFIIGANETFKATTGFTNDIYQEPYRIDKVQENVLGVFQRWEAAQNATAPEDKRVYALTKIECSHYPCKIQVFEVFESTYLKLKFDDGNFSVSRTTGRKTFVSTKRSGSVTIPYTFEQTVNDKKLTQTFIFPFAFVTGFTKKSFSYKFGKNMFITLFHDAGLNFTNETSGFIHNTSYLNEWANPERLNKLDYKYDENPQNFKFNGNFTLTWEESKKEESGEEKQMLIPEFEATLSTKGGGFTKDNIDQAYPLSKEGLSASAIAGIVIACVAVVAIIAVCIWLFAFGGIRKCKKDKSESASGSNNEQEDK